MYRELGVYHELGVAVFYNGLHVDRIPRKRRYDTEKCMTWGVSSENRLRYYKVYAATV